MVQYSVPHLVEFWGDRCLNAIVGSTCRQYTKWRTSSGVSPQTARRDLEVLRATINHFHREHGLDAVPVVTLPPKGQARQRWLTRGETARLLWAARRSHVARFILIGVYTGTRSAAILGLSWDRQDETGWVDLEAGILYRSQGGGLQPRSKKRQPPARIPTRLLAHLLRWRRIDTAAGVRFIVHYQGERLRKMRRSWAGARARAGLGSEVVPHILRHTAATWLMQAGVPAWEAAGYLGMTVETLESVYGHHHPDFQGGVAKAFG